jgi:5-keto-L-gluconate epimerase
VRLSYTVATPEVSVMPNAWVDDLPTVLARLADLGYAGVEFQTREPGGVDAGHLARLLDHAGLTATGVSTGPAVAADALFLTSPDPAVRAAAADRLDAALELAANLGTHLAVGSIRGYLRWADDPTTALGWFRAELETLLGRAETLGTRVVIEPQGRTVTDFLTTVAEALDFAADYGPVLAIEADTFHAAAEERSVVAALVQAQRSGRLAHVQVSDSNRRAPGWGHLDWVDIVETLRAGGYDGWLSVEANQIPDSATVARHSHTFLTGLLADGPDG